jgi:microsomal dipeptidase-like Zn-dependent dipeptidase
MFRVYYTDPLSGQAHGHDLESLTEALSYTEGFRKLGMIFVTMVSENPESVGKSGVDSIKDGLCPDGVAYDWNKNSRIGATKKR